MVSRFVVLLLPLATFAQISAEMLDQAVVTQEMVDEINSMGEWTASLDWARGLTHRSAMRKLGHLHDESESIREVKREVERSQLGLPSAFDSRQAWPGCVGAIRDQGSCGSCWAFASTETLADRICIHLGQKVTLSPQWLVSCDPLNLGCDGGYEDYVWAYFRSHGAPLDSCDTYVSGETGESYECPLDCSSQYFVTNITRYYTPIDIQAAIISSGPVHSSFEVYQDFFAYQSGVYRHLKGGFEGMHAIKIVGWGVQGATNYWIVANSWGPQWGIDGFFWIAFGNCGIDDKAIAGMPYSGLILSAS